MTTLPITEQSNQKDWETIMAIARNNGYPSNEIHGLKARIEKRQKQKQQQQQQQNETTKTKQKWAVFTYNSPLIRKVTNMFK
jgi:hypothetical protein